jgi:hypothetical protein
MEIKFSSEEVRLWLNDLVKIRPDLYKKYIVFIDEIKSFDYGDFKYYLNQELRKGERSKSKMVKRLGGDNLYEFRIPPHDKKGVLRVEFEDEGNYYTLCITRAYIKDWN